MKQSYIQVILRPQRHYFPPSFSIQMCNFVFALAVRAVKVLKNTRFERERATRSNSLPLHLLMANVCVSMSTRAAACMHTRCVWVCLCVNYSTRVWMAAGKYRTFQLLHPPWTQQYMNTRCTHTTPTATDTHTHTYTDARNAHMQPHI